MKSYPAEVRQRAVRLVLDHRGDYPTEHEALKSIAAKCNVNAETLRRWVRQAQTDAGTRGGLTTEEKEEIRRLKKENAELRRANEILKAASIFFAAELDRPPTRS